jgi:dihydrofolate synthase/folylpolyglutamate synthase
MAILGNTLSQIATEKAGIIKPHGTVVTSAQAPEALRVIAATCQQQQASLIRVGAADGDPAQAEVDAGHLPPLSYRYQLEHRSAEQQRFTIRTPEHTYTGLEIPLAGQYQLENASAALATLDRLRQHGIAWNETALREGFRSVHWPARIEVVGQNPTIVVDGAHNADSMQKLIQALRDSFSIHRLIVVLSIAQDKDKVGIAQALADVDTVILTHMHTPRATSIEVLETTFAEHAPHVSLYKASESDAAMELALDMAERNDLICATGSLYLAGEVLRWAAARGDKTAAEEIEGVDH